MCELYLSMIRVPWLYISFTYVQTFNYTGLLENLDRIRFQAHCFSCSDVAVRVMQGLGGPVLDPGRPGMPLHQVPQQVREEPVQEGAVGGLVMRLAMNKMTIVNTV